MTGCHLQRGPSRPWLPCCRGRVYPSPARGSCLPLCTVAHGYSHMATATLTHTHPYIHTQSSLHRACSHLRCLGHGARGHTHIHMPLPIDTTLSPCPTYAHLHTNSTMRYTEVPTDAYSLPHPHLCSPLTPPGMGKQFQQGKLGEYFLCLRLCSKDFLGLL